MVPASTVSEMPSTALTSVRSRRNRLVRRHTVKVFSTWSSSMRATSASRAPVAAHGGVPSAGCHRAKGHRDQRRGEHEPPWTAQWIRLVQNVETRVVGGEGERYDKGEDPPQPDTEDLQWVFGQEAAS